MYTPNRPELHAEERESDAGREHQEHQGEEADDPDGDERDLDRATAQRLAGEHPPHARGVQREPFEQQDREEEQPLVRHQPSERPDARRSAMRLLGGERDHRQLDVGIGADLVRVGVVPGVLVLPPSVAHADEEVADDQGRPVVPSPGAEDLAVRRVVPEHRDLGEDHRHRGGRDELPPGVAHEHECRDRGREDHGHRDELGPVVAVATPHQAALGDHMGELREVVRPVTPDAAPNPRTVGGCADVGHVDPLTVVVGASRMSGVQDIRFPMYAAGATRGESRLSSLHRAPRGISTLRSPRPDPRRGGAVRVASLHGPDDIRLRERR